MTEASLLAFGFTLFVGTALAFHVIRDSYAPWLLSAIHALLGTIGLVLLILDVRSDPGHGIASTGLILMLIAALGGFYLAYCHLNEQIPSKVRVLRHASIGVLGFVLLGWVVLSE
ncbi:MAG: hypothetical protein AB7I04_13380 [Pseudomonadales bacterium]